MKIAIISDIHDNLVNLKKCFGWCEKENIERIICCGDITNSETLKFLAENFNGQIYLIRGNLEIYEEGEEKKFKNIIYLGRIGKIELDGKLIGICHEPAFINKVISLCAKQQGSGSTEVKDNFSAKISAGKPYLINKILEAGKRDIIFYGHTHKPWIEEKNGIKLINPGTLGGVFQKATFAAWDTAKKEPELKILEEL